MKKFENPELKVLSFGETDIITTSGMETTTVIDDFNAGKQTQNIFF